MKVRGVHQHRVELTCKCGTVESYWRPSFVTYIEKEGISVNDFLKKYLCKNCNGGVGIPVSECETRKHEKLVDIDLTGEGVCRYPSPEIEGWKYARIEYGGCNEDCYWEGKIFLPPQVDSFIITQMFEILQIPEAREAFEKAVKKIHKEKVGKKSHWREGV